MKNSRTFDKNFQEAVEYVNEVISQFARSTSEEEDLLQEFALEVLSKPEHYGPLISDNRNVYFILKGISKSKYKMNSRDISINEETFYYEPAFAEDTIREDLTEHLRNSQRVTEMQQQLNQIESILYKVIQHNGRKNQVKTYAQQKQILKDYKESKVSQRKFCKQSGISTATLHKLLTKGPKKVQEPLTIQWFKLFHIHGLTTSDIAKRYGVTNHTVSQQIHYAKTKINQYLLELSNQLS